MKSAFEYFSRKCFNRHLNSRRKYKSRNRWKILKRRSKAKLQEQLYGNCWITAWTSDWSPEVSTESAGGAQLKAIHLCDQKGVEPGCTSPRPHLRADCPWGRVSFWSLLLLEFFLWVYNVGEHFSTISNYNLSSYTVCGCWYLTTPLSVFVDYTMNNDS